MRRYLVIYLRAVVCLLIAMATLPSLFAGTIRTQSIALHRGWNSVFLEVTPAENDPAVVFSNLPVRIVATHFPMSSGVQFIKDPSAVQWKKEGWGVWYGNGRADSFLSTLHAIDGNRAYLIQAESDCVLAVTGYVTFEPARWKNDSYNHFGFGVDSLSPPTFSKFFASSTAHKQMKIYRLENDRWVAVQDPITETLHSGEAYWIYCQGSSDFQGPLNVKLPAGRGVLFSDTAVTCALALRNDAVDPLKVIVEGGDALPLTYVVRAIGEGKMVDVPVKVPSRLAVPTLESGERTGLKLELRREQLATSSGSALLKITTDLGTELWLPVAAARSDVSANP